MFRYIFHEVSSIKAIDKATRGGNTALSKGRKMINIR